MTTDMNGRVAVITGAGGDIGGAAALQFAARGAAVVAVDHNPQGLAALAERMPESADFICLTADVSREAEVEAYVRQTLKTYGRIDFFFNNAGTEGTATGAWRQIAELSLEDFRHTMNVNARGVFLGLKFVLPVMGRAGAGAVVNTSSIYGLKGSRHQAPYVASKHAVRSMTASAAKAWAAAGVRVNAIAPGAIQGRMLRDFVAIIQAAAPPPDPDAPVRYNPPPIERWSDPHEIAAMALFLFSDAARHINGACYSVDGGLAAL